VAAQGAAGDNSLFQVVEVDHPFQAVRGAGALQPAAGSRQDFSIRAEGQCGRCFISGAEGQAFTNRFTCDRIQQVDLAGVGGFVSQANAIRAEGQRRGGSGHGDALNDRSHIPMGHLLPGGPIYQADFSVRATFDGIAVIRRTNADGDTPPIRAEGQRI
jgi:hypothetical protein